MADYMDLTDESGTICSVVPDSAEKYFGKIIAYISKKNPAFGFASGLIIKRRRLVTLVVSKALAVYLSTCF